MENRVEKIIEHQHKKNVLYLSQRDYRANNNYSLFLAYSLSKQTETSLFVGTDIKSIQQNKLQKAFMIEGLHELDAQYNSLNIEYFIIERLDKFVSDKNIDCIVTEFSPMRDVLEAQNKIKKMCSKNKLALYICDSHNLMPCRMVGEYVKNFRGLKTRFYKQWEKYYNMHNKLKPHEYNKIKKIKDSSTHENKDYFKLDIYKFEKCNNYTQFKGGYSNAIKELHSFINDQLPRYNKLREKPTAEILGTLGPWIDGGQISIYEVLRELIKKEGNDSENVERYITELVMWRQTAEHFCYYEKNYDNIDCALSWARETLDAHKNDKRIHEYTLNELRDAKTDNDEWNAAQKEMLLTGEIHPYVRFFWGKKILTWTKNAEQAIEYANALINDLSYEGNRPIGYLNTMYSICGTMDQGWSETEIRGKIRGMNSIKAKDYVLKWVNSNVKKK